jgi:DNA-binding transcriptional LysR family regulator
MLRMAVLFAAIAVPTQILVGDLHGLEVGEYQPTKLAAIEAHWASGEPGAGVPLVLFARESAPVLYDTIARTFDAEGVTLRPRHHATDLTSAFMLVGAGLGVSVMPAGLQPPRSFGVTCRPLRPPVASVEFGVACRADASGPAVRRFVAALRAIGASPARARAAAVARHLA